MATRCDTCGNLYDKPLQVTKDGTSYTFDSFECAIHKLAPACVSCGCKIVGHGIESQGAFYCCVHCSRQAGVVGAVDRVA
jgi:hypothetical protein